MPYTPTPPDTTAPNATMPAQSKKAHSCTSFTASKKRIHTAGNAGKKARSPERKALRLNGGCPFPNINAASEKTAWLQSRLAELLATQSYVDAQRLLEKVSRLLQNRKYFCPKHKRWISLTFRRIGDECARALHARYPAEATRDEIDYLAFYYCEGRFTTEMVESLNVDLTDSDADASDEEADAGGGEAVSDP